MDLPADTVDVAVVAEHPTRNRLLAGILALLLLHACAVAAVLVVPLLFALLLSLMLSPVVRLLSRWLPRALAVTLVMASTLSVVGALLFSLVGPARDWMDQVPTAMTRIERSLSVLRSPLREASEAGEKIARLGDIDGQSRLQHVVAAGPSWLEGMISATPGALGSLVASLVLIFIFLLKGDSMLRKLVELAPALHLKKDIVMATRSAQQELSTYIITITGINSVLGLLLAGVLWWLGVADPLLWGAIAAILKFVPFVGPILAILILTVVGFGHFDTLLPALAVPTAFIALNAIEELLTPQFVGRRLQLDPVMVFLALMLCGWLWGPAGLLLATPLLTCVRIVADRIPAWNPLAKLLGD